MMENAHMTRKYVHKALPVILCIAAGILILSGCEVNLFGIDKEKYAVLRVDGTVFMEHDSTAVPDALVVLKSKKVLIFAPPVTQRLKSVDSDSAGKFSMVHGAMKCDKFYFLEVLYGTETTSYHHSGKRVECEEGVQTIDFYLVENEQGLQ
ncbi:MAG: hypothetical protein R3283_02890 [Balneolaceae bacterium]|nr:hypothetical protein [Balneolaceae bacterium]